MQIMIVISAALAAIYVGAAICRTKRLPDSVSALCYVFPKCKWLWTLWLWIVALLLAPCLIEILNEPYRFFGFLTIALLVFCGAVPLFEKDNHGMHNACGISAGILSQVCVAIINPWWLASWSLWFAAFVWQTKDRPYSEWRWSVFLAECICYVNLVVVLM